MVASPQSSPEVQPIPRSATAKATPPSTEFHVAAGGDWSLRLHQRGRQHLVLRGLQIALVVGVAGSMLIASRLSDPMGDVLTYAAWGAAMLAGGVAGILRGRLAEQRMKLRWILLGVSLCSGSVAYFVASLNNFAAVFHVLDPVLLLAGTCGTAAVLLSVTISFTGAPRSIVLLDLAQTAVFITLGYVVNAGSNPWARTVQSHVVISLLYAMVLFLTAVVAPYSATTMQERRFFRVVTLYLGGLWIGRFLSAQVGYLWMNYRGNVYNVPMIGTYVLMALFLMQSVWRTSQAPERDCELAAPGLMLRNLLPSVLGFASLLVGLYVFLHVQLPGLLAILCVVLLYLWRTTLLQMHVGREAAALRHHNEHLEAISQRDPLTGAGNRRSLAARHERCLEESPVWVTLLLVDLDFFKQANDTLGHLHGDFVLRKVAAVLHAACAAIAGSHVARFGGDEFALLLPQVDAAHAADLAETIRATVESLALEAGDCAVSVSIGGVATHGTEPLDELIRCADLALYRAKLEGRNRAEFHFSQPAASPGTADLEFASVG